MKRVRGRISNFAEYSISSLSSCQRDGLGEEKGKVSADFELFA